MVKGDKFHNESGFVDEADAVEEAFEDTVHVPSYRAQQEDDSSQTRPTSPKNDTGAEQGPQETQIHVADLTWEFEEEAYSGDAPLAQALDAEPVKVSSSKRSDFFERSDSPVEKTRFTPRDFPQLAENTRYETGPSAMRVSDFAQQAERLKWQSAKHDSETSIGAKKVSSASAHSGRREELDDPKRPKREYPMMRSLLKNPPESSQSEESDISSSPPVPGTFFPTSSKKELVPEDAPPDMEGLLAKMAEGVLLGGASDGSSHMMVTLNDEYFRGTELRISFEAAGVKAHLIPPDYEIYRHLSSELPRLEQRLLARGLTVNEVSVLKP